MSGSLKAFNEWYKNIEKEYPLYQDKDGYNIGNTRALKVGWEAALKWVLEQKEWQDTDGKWGTDDCGSLGVDTWVIEEELKGK